MERGDRRRAVPYPVTNGLLYRRAISDQLKIHGTTASLSLGRILTKVISKVLDNQKCNLVVSGELTHTVPEVFYQI